jgi:3-deoxy-7-phosphoheptulonate synthase
MEDVLRVIKSRVALQQPDYTDIHQVRRVRETLEARPPLTRGEDIRTLRSLMARVAEGKAMVVQAGDCAEDVNESTADVVARKTAVLDMLAGALRMVTCLPVVRIGRIAGQFAKPRSKPTELVGGHELAVYRGDMVNGPEPTEESRQADPLRILAGFMAANDIIEHLGWKGATAGTGIDAPMWTSHEALLLDYEIPMLRRDKLSGVFLGSTHLPWIGERTRQVDGAHVALLSEVNNPVACKVGPTTTVDEVLMLCERLDPAREPGRLTLVARMGTSNVAGRLPTLVAAVRAAGHPVVWLVDPMHGNTIVAPSGHKTRTVDAIAGEVRLFCAAVASEGGVAGGLHLETTPDDVTECVVDDAGLAVVGDRYTSLCDPRLTVAQAITVVSAWQRRTGAQDWRSVA